MNIPLTTISKASEKGLSVTEIVYLLIIQDGSSYLFKDFDSYFNSCYLKLQSQGLIKFNNGVFELTSKAILLLKEINGIEAVSKIVDNKYKDLYVKLGEVLKSKIGKKQIMGYGGKYFMPSSALELENTLKRFWKFYPEYNDIVKIEKSLTKHIETCCKKNNFAPAVQYFIIRENEKNKPICQILSAYDGLNEVEIEEKVEPKDIKNLF